jgi:hypothetical protein
MNMRVVIEFHPDESLHRDIIVNANEEQFLCDSYYFALDQKFDSQEESDKKSLKVLIKLLEQWMCAVDELKREETIFLPFDFSDQSTGCFKCWLEDEKLKVQPGWSSKEGWSVYPSQLDSYIKSITDFRASCDHPMSYDNKKDFQLETLSSLEKLKTKECLFS